MGVWGRGMGGRCRYKIVAVIIRAASCETRRLNQCSVGVACRFTAIRGQGSRLNGEKIQVGEQGTLLESLVAAGKSRFLSNCRVIVGRSV